MSNVAQNLANYEAHFRGTGPEIWQQTSGRVNACVRRCIGTTITDDCIASWQVQVTISLILSGLPRFYTLKGTGGTLAGVARYLKQLKPEVRIVLADPPGSGLFNRVRTLATVLIKSLRMWHRSSTA